MLTMRKIAVAVALGTLGGVALSAAPASAAQPPLACYSNEDGSLLWLLEASPGDDDWGLAVALCRLEKSPTHIGPYFP